MTILSESLTMKNDLNIKKILDNCQYPNFRFNVYSDEEETYLQVSTDTVDLVTGEIWKDCRGRKWRLSEHMCESEIVQTAFKAIITFIEHEVREGFTYYGKRIFGPHIDVKALLEIADRTETRK